MEFRGIPILILFAALLIASSDLMNAQRSISGRAISVEDSLGVEGINVEFTQVDGTKKRTQTDSLGYYRFDNITAVELMENQTPLQIRTGVWSNPSSAPVFGYSMPSASHVTVKVYDVLGREVRVLSDGDIAPGAHTLQWNGKDNRNALVSNGVYFISMMADNKIIASEKIAFDSHAPQGSIHASMTLPHTTSSLAKITARPEIISFTDSTRKRFIPYIKTDVATTDTKINAAMMPDQDLLYPIGTTIVTKKAELFKYEQNVDIGANFLKAPLYPMQIFLDSGNAPEGWLAYLRKGIQMKNDSAHKLLIQEVPTLYTGMDKTSITCNYIYNSGTPPLGSKIATYSAEMITTTNGVLKGTVWFNVTRMTGESADYTINHEINRIENYGGRNPPSGGANNDKYKVINPSYIAPFTINPDEARIGRWLSNFPQNEKIDLNNHKTSWP